MSRHRNCTAVISRSKVLTRYAEIELAAFATMAQKRVSAVQFGASILFQVINHRLVELAAPYRIPAS